MDKIQTANSKYLIVNSYHRIQKDTSEEDSQRYKNLDYKEFLQTDYWRTISAYIKTRDGNKCCECNSSRNLHVHHLTYKNHGHEHKHPDDLITLCKICHRKIHEAKPSRKSSKRNKFVKSSMALKSVKEQIAKEIQAYLKKNPSIKVPNSLNKLLKTKNRTIDRFFMAAKKIDIQIDVIIKFPNNHQGK